MKVRRLVINSHDAPLISVIIPTYQEEAGIESVVRGVRALELPRCEIIVVDDGSTDRSARLAKQEGARVISRWRNMGNGAAVKEGIRAARGEILVMLDADGQHRPPDILKLLAHIGDCAMVVGSRDFSRSRVQRGIANRLLSCFASLVCSYEIADLTSGFRIIRRQDALRFCDILPNGFSYPTTITLAFLRSGRLVQYVPISSGASLSASKIVMWRDGPRFLLVILKIIGGFSPMRVFAPISVSLCGLGLMRYAQTYFAHGTFTNMSAVLLLSSLMVLLFGVLSEQIAMRFLLDDYRLNGELNSLEREYRFNQACEEIKAHLGSDALLAADQVVGAL